MSLHDKDGTLPLHMAAAACDATVLKKVVAVMARTDRRTMTDVRDQRGQQAMHYAGVRDPSHPPLRPPSFSSSLADTRGR